MNLSKQQTLIVQSELNKPIQVLASAAYGKTRVLTERIRYILNNTKKDGVIALTFTNKAADEMASRLNDCEQVNERLWISTIHSFAQRILEKYAHTIGLPEDLHIYERESDKIQLFMQSLRDDGIDIDSYLNVTDTKEKRNRENTLRKYLSIFSEIKRDLLTESDINNRFPDNNIWKIYQDYQSALLKAGGIDYDDILVYSYKILLDHEWIANIYRSQYKHICVDEAQDLNQIQYELIKIMCGDSIQSILMVGDSNQMIYGFNGSSEKYLCEKFIEDFSPIQFQLKENYRSSKAIINAANKLRPNSQLESEYALQGILEISQFENEEVEAKAITKHILELLAIEENDEIEGIISLEKMVVIARNRFVFSSLEKELNEYNIPFSLKKSERQTEPESKFGKVLDYGIRLKLNPKSWIDREKLYKSLDVRINLNEIVSLTIIADQISNELVTTDLLKDLLIKIDNLDIESPNIRKFYNEFLESLTELGNNHKNTDDLMSEEIIKRSIEELKEFYESWTRFKQKSLGESLLNFRNALSLGQLTDEPQNGGLTLSTVHTMKGLEKDIVFLMGMCQGVFPDYRATTPEKQDEELNNAFVAITRAKRWLFISYPEYRMMPWGDIRYQDASQYLKIINN